jgi:hypothetical protein
VIHALHFFALVQAVIGVLVFLLPKALGWQPALAAMPRLMREIYHVHAFYLSFTLWIFAGFTVAFGDQMVAGDAAMGALAFWIGVFWAVRVAIQLFYYSPRHWRGKPRETVVHLVFLVVYALMSSAYLSV